MQHANDPRVTVVDIESGDIINSVCLICLSELYKTSAYIQCTGPNLSVCPQYFDGVHKHSVHLECITKNGQYVYGTECPAKCGSQL